MYILSHSPAVSAMVQFFYQENAFYCSFSCQTGSILLNRKGGAYSCRTTNHPSVFCPLGRSHPPAGLQIRQSLPFPLAEYPRRQQDAEECVNDAYLGAWNTIPPQNPSPLLSYICKIVRNLSLRCLRQKTAARRNSHYDVALHELEGCLSSAGTLDDQLDAKDWLPLSGSFWTACRWKTG